MTMVSPELLRRFPFFAGLNEDQLRGVAMLAEEVTFEDGKVVVCEDDLVEKLYIITSGSVELLLTMCGPGPRQYVGSLTVGEPFGVYSLVEPYKATAAVRADGPVKAIAIDATGLRAMCMVDCRLGYALLQQGARALQERLNATRVQLAGMAPA